MRSADYLKTVKAKVAVGEDINRLEGSESPLTLYIDLYYDEVFCVDEWDPCDSAAYEDNPAAAEEFARPLRERDVALLKALDWFFAHGANANAGKNEFPLMRSVANLDVPLTEYLLEHGADPNWGEELLDGISHGGGNWYINELDIQAMHNSFLTEPDAALFDRILKTAAVLAAHGVTASGDYCIRIDPQTRIVTLKSAEVLF